MFGQMMVKLQVEQSLGWWPAVVRFGSTDNVLAEGFIQVPPLEAGGMTPPEWFNLLKVGM